MKPFLFLFLFLSFLVSCKKEEPKKELDSIKILEDSKLVELSKPCPYITEEYCQSWDSCQQDAPQECLQAGLQNYYGKGVEVHYPLAKLLFMKSCNLLQGKACFYLGKIYNKGLHVEKDQEKANKLFQKACLLRYGKGCRKIGDYFNNQNKKELSKKILTYYSKACNYDDIQSCYDLGLLYQEGSSIIGLSKNCTLSQGYFQKACKKQFQKACNQPCNERKQ